MNGKAGMVIVVGVVLLATSTFAGVNTTLPEIDDRQYEETISFSVTFSQPEILENEEYSVINADNNMMYIRNEGSPLLPYTTKTFILPFGTEIKNVEVKTSDVKTMYVENKIMPSPSPIPFNMEDVHVELKEGEVYESEEISEGIIIDYNKEGDVVGVEILNFSKRKIDLNKIIRLRDEEIIHEVSS